MHYNLFGGLQRKRGRALPLLGIEHHPVNVAPLRGMTRTGGVEAHIA